MCRARQIVAVGALLLQSGCLRWAWSPTEADGWLRDGGSGSLEGAPGDGGSGDGGAVGDGAAPANGGGLPVVTGFVVTNAAGGRTHAKGDPVEIGWTVIDAEGLASGPVDLYYTTDNNVWTVIVQGFGGLAGNPTSYTGSFPSFVAPGDGYFRLKIVARDRDGNTSVPALSDVQNTGPWSVYAGSADVGLGGSSRAAWPFSADNVTQTLAVDPQTGDLYLRDHDRGVLRHDSKTGTVSVFLAHDATTNLPDDGPLPANPTAVAPIVRFDADGMLYVMPGDWSYGALQKIYQIDLSTSQVRVYLGGGVVNDNSATPQTVSVQRGPFAFDESHALYFLSSCSPGSWNSGSAFRILKATQLADKRAGEISVVAGNCVRANPVSPGPVDALTSPLADAPYPAIGSFDVWNDGAVLYYSFYPGDVRKILNGKNYRSNIVVSKSGSLRYNRVSKKLYALDGKVQEVTPNLAGPDGEVAATYIASTGTGADCLADGVAAEQACVNAHFGMDVAADGTLLFVDGPGLNGDRHFRVRHRDSAGGLRTTLGTLPLFGAGLDRRVIRGRFAGIHYKPASAGNQAAFPEGLYFVDGSALVFGYIDPSTDKMTVQWGNQQGNLVVHPSGVTIGPEVSLGDAYAGGNVMAFSFDSAGLPWLRYNDVLVRVDSARKTVKLQDDGIHWELAPDGADPALYDLFAYGLWQNTVIKNSGVFLIGGHSGTTSTMSIRYFDFGAQTVIKVMGSSANKASGDSDSPGSVANLSLSSSCQGQGSCHGVYRPSEDRLFFGEEDKVRYITHPTNTSTATLGTLFSLGGGRRIENLIFSADGSQLFYLEGGRLRCHDLGSGKAWCNDSDLGPAAGLQPIDRGPDQLTWKGSSLLISSYRGEIYEYTPSP